MGRLDGLPARAVPVGVGLVLGSGFGADSRAGVWVSRFLPRLGSFQLMVLAAPTCSTLFMTNLHVYYLGNYVKNVKQIFLSKCLGSSSLGSTYQIELDLNW